MTAVFSRLALDYLGFGSLYVNNSTSTHFPLLLQNVVVLFQRRFCKCFFTRAVTFSPFHFSRAANSGLRCLFCCKFCFSSSSNLYSASHSPYTYCRSASLPRGRAALFRCRTFPSLENGGKGYIIVALVMLLGCENVSPFRHGASSGSSVLTAGALMIRNSCGWEKGGGSRLGFSISNFFSRHFEGLLSSYLFGGDPLLQCN